MIWGDILVVYLGLGDMKYFISVDEGSQSSRSW